MLPCASIDFVANMIDLTPSADRWAKQLNEANLPSFTSVTSSAAGQSAATGLSAARKEVPAVVP